MLGSLLYPALVYATNTIRASRVCLLGYESNVFPGACCLHTNDTTTPVSKWGAPLSATTGHSYTGSNGLPGSSATIEMEDNPDSFGLIIDSKNTIEN